MERFNRDTAGELREFLYTSCVHDAKVETVEYDRRTNSVRVELYNPIFGERIAFTFLDIAAALAIRGRQRGNWGTLVSLTVEDDYSELANFLTEPGGSLRDSLYMLFQTFTGEELHIAAKEVAVETAGR